MPSMISMDQHVGGMFCCSDNAVLDIPHELFIIKRPLFVVVVISLVRISSAQWEGSSFCPKHQPGQQQGGSLDKHKHGEAQGAILPVRPRSTIHGN